MALPTTKTDFKNYILRKLGQGAIDINVTIDQVNDRVDEALEHFNEYHDEGTERIYVKYQLQQADIDNGYVILPDNIIGVSGILPTSGSSGGAAMFNVDFQFWLSNISDITSGSTQHFYIAMQHVEHIQNMFDNFMPVRYNRTTNKLYIDDNLSVRFSAGDYIVLEAYGIVDGSANERVWQNKWLRDYATALVKKQWGENLAKFSGVQMIGGTTFDAQRLIEEANTEIEKLEQQVKQDETAPMGIFIG